MVKKLKDFVEYLAAIEVTPNVYNQYSYKYKESSIRRNNLLQYDINVLSWNAFPFHPHKKDDEESNRAPLKKELLIGEKPLLQMIEMFEIEKVIAMGNKAEESLNRIGIDCYKVRHPAQGGKNEFVEGIRKFG